MATDKYLTTFNKIEVGAGSYQPRGMISNCEIVKLGDKNTV